MIQGFSFRGFYHNILIISEKKSDEEFSILQFFVENYDMRNRKNGNEYGGGLTEFVKKGQICKKVSENVTSEIIVSKIKESGKKPHFGTQLFLIQKSGFLIHQISQPAVTMPNIRKKLMIQSRESLVTDGRTDRQTGGRE